VGRPRPDTCERTWAAEVAQGYGPLVAILLLLIAAAVFFPMMNVLDEAPAVVTEADLASLRASPMVPGSAESRSPDLSVGSRGYRSACTRDHAVHWLAETLHFPEAQRLRFEYVLITDCRLRGS